MTRAVLLSGATVAKRVAPVTQSAQRTVRVASQPSNWSAGIATSTMGSRRYRLYKPPGVRRGERLPLLVMLHGCRQDAEALAASSRMNRIAARERFLVLYPEQDRLAHGQSCWNWYETRSGRAQREVLSIDAAIDQVCRRHPVDKNRIALAGLSAGAGIAALLAVHRPERFRAVAMHSGVGPGVAHSLTSAIGAMRGRNIGGALPTPPVQGTQLPPLLVIHGSSDTIVAPDNGAEAVRLWAESAAAKAKKPRIVKRGSRYPVTITDFRTRNRLVATLCEVHGLGHAWSGGTAGQPFSDAKGPDASRMIWTFAARQFAVPGEPKTGP